ncbi:MAG: hypothetical protein ACP5KG_08070, partial [Myxococcota bacterium]
MDKFTFSRSGCPLFFNIISIKCCPTFLTFNVGCPTSGTIGGVLKGLSVGFVKNCCNPYSYKAPLKD